MPKSITMRATVAFDYRGAKLRPGDTFSPHSAVEAVALKTRKKADFTRIPARQVDTPRVPVPVPVSTSSSLRTSQLTPDDDTADDAADDPVDDAPSDSPQTSRGGRGRGGRGRYNRQDLRPSE